MLAGLLVGCGSSSEPSVSSSKISGVAVDDLIVSGDVVAYPIGEPNNILKRGKTDASSGAYTLELNHNGVVVVEVTCGTTDKMKNPQTGQMRSCEQDLKLHSAAAISSRVSKVTVNVSPLTDFVVTQMRANGGDTEAFQAAQKNIGEMFGFNPIAENPIEHTNYAATVASIRELADKKNETLMQVVEKMNDDLKDGESGDDGQIAFELAEVMKSKNINTEFAKNDGVVKPDTTVVKSDIEITKAFFNELGTQAMSIVDYNQTGTDGFLDKEAKNLGNILKNETLNINIVGEYAVDIIGDIMNAIDNDQTSYTAEGARTVTVEKKSDYVWDYSITENSTETFSGRVTLPSQAIKEITPANFTTLEAKFEGTLPLKESEAGSQDVKLDAVLNKTTAGVNVHLKALSITHDKTSIALSDLKGSASYDYDESKAEDERVTAHFIQFDEGAVVGKVDGYQLDGLLKISEYVTNNSIQGNGWEKKIDEDRKFYNSGKLPKKALFRGSIKNTKTNGEISGMVNVDWVNAASMNLTNDSTDEAHVKASINGSIKMPSRPEMSLTLGYENPNQTNNFTLSYAYGATTISGDATFDKEMKNGQIILRTHEGVKFVVKVADGEIVYGDESVVMRNGRRVGRLEERESVPVIKYTDGTFESLP